MFILTRKIGETVVIGDDIYCTVLGACGNQIRLSIDAPRTLPINRLELQMAGEVAQSTVSTGHRVVVI